MNKQCLILLFNKKIKHYTCNRQKYITYILEFNFNTFSHFHIKLKILFN